ncbi:uncharacterized protein B0T23DRAFT_73864 [Neurospora hispaniola]|uniref:Uncharacterized protein n=1 Tax=Neurospora hispaniola TaxID=588809 RepID=A0AAJ0ICE1_9PEZI|nr:hypothetical protein B0T23DRAFT_73864 [Neurospora hispaniola]
MLFGYLGFVICFFLLHFLSFSFVECILPHFDRDGMLNFQGRLGQGVRMIETMIFFPHFLRALHIPAAFFHFQCYLSSLGSFEFRIVVRILSSPSDRYNFGLVLLSGFIYGEVRCWVASCDFSPDLPFPCSEPLPVFKDDGADAKFLSNSHAGWLFPAMAL